MRTLLLLSILSVLGTISCNPQVSSTTNNAVTATTSPEIKKNQIIYLFFEAETTANGEQITLKDKKITEGTLKNSAIEQAERIPGNIVVQMMGNGGTVVEERIIEDPLNPVMESYSEEGIEKGKMKLQRAEFSVRFNQTGNISTIKLEKLLPNGKKHLLTINL